MSERTRKIMRMCLENSSKHVSASSSHDESFDDTDGDKNYDPSSSESESDFSEDAINPSLACNNPDGSDLLTLSAEKGIRCGTHSDVDILTLEVSSTLVDYASDFQTIPAEEESCRREIPSDADTLSLEVASTHYVEKTPDYQTFLAEEDVHSKRPCDVDILFPEAAATQENASASQTLPTDDGHGTETPYDDAVPLKGKRRISARLDAKEKRLRGEAYEGVKGVQRSARSMLPPPCSHNGRNQLCASIGENARQQIFHDFRSLTSIDQQRSFISRHVTSKTKQRATNYGAPSRRESTNVYSFTIDKQCITVCRKFFMATLNITDALIRSSLNKTSGTGVTQPDKRGRHVPHNKLSSEEDAKVREFILSFPTMKSHYCRKSTDKKYLDAKLNIAIMFRMFAEYCQKEGLRKISFESFRKIFREYKLGFFRPKKDQCRKCIIFHTLPEKDKPNHDKEFKEHIARKLAARQSRDQDKLLALEDESYLTFNFDLEAVLNVPKGDAGQIFYMRKLAVYNFTIFDLKSHDGHCYLWSETEGKRGANEIGSCLYNYIKMKADTTPAISSIRMMSDSCAGQNKNSLIAAMCIHLLKTTPSLQTIRHSFFEPGHSEMECDSIHSKIERKSKRVPVFLPEGWAQIIRCARLKPSPFVVQTLSFSDFYDFSRLSKASSLTLPWRNVCSIEYRKIDQGQVDVFYKRDYNEEFQRAAFKRSRGRPSAEALELQQAYTNTLPITVAKYKDLMKMCEDLTIPKEYHSYFTSLNSEVTQVDTLPDPDVSEDSEYEE